MPAVSPEEPAPPTRALAHFVVTTEPSHLPADIIHEAKRTLINILGVALSASRADSSLALTDWARRRGGDPRATVLGGNLRTDASTTAFVNAYLAHLQDYDDTHFPTVLHPSAPVWPAALAVCETQHRSGLDALAAFALGAEVCCRVAMSVHPWHYDLGWHITGTAGVFGAAAAAGRASGLSEAELTHALSMAGTRAAGVRESFGSDAKPLHASYAARAGVESAQLAAAGLTGAADILRGRRGFWAVLSPNGHSTESLLDGLGERWELRNNGLKPYANGVVSHAIEDAVIEMRNAHQLAAEQVERIDAQVHPLVLELMDRPVRQRGLDGKFSYQHCAAVALVDGAAHEAQFSDKRVADPAIVALASRVHAAVAAGIAEDEVKLTITLTDGRQLSTHIEHASGSPGNPLSDAAVDAKFMATASEGIGDERAARLLAAAWALDGAESIGNLMALASGAPAMPDGRQSVR